MSCGWWISLSTSFKSLMSWAVVGPIVNCIQVYQRSLCDFPNTRMRRMVLVWKEFPLDGKSHWDQHDVFSSPTKLTIYASLGRRGRQTCIFINHLNQPGSCSFFGFNWKGKEKRKKFFLFNCICSFSFKCLNPSPPSYNGQFVNVILKQIGSIHEWIVFLLPFANDIQTNC